MCRKRNCFSPGNYTTTISLILSRYPSNHLTVATYLTARSTSISSIYSTTSTILQLSLSPLLFTWESGPAVILLSISLQLCLLRVPYILLLFPPKSDKRHPTHLLAPKHQTKCDNTDRPTRVINSPPPPSPM